MRKRILSAIAVIAVVGVVTILSMKWPVSIDFFVAVICAVSVFEFTKAVRTINLYQISILSIAFAFLFPVFLSFGLGFILCYVYTALMLAMIIFFHTKISFKDFAYTYSMITIITLSLSMLVMIRNTEPSHSTLYFLMSLGIPWLADAAAYFTGVFFGKHKLCPKISPKKTIEGAVGGIILCTSLACLLVYLFGKILYHDISVNFINIAIISCCGSLLSILGDLSFSVIKRSYSVKDYGDVIPGHGGILDRFDSVIPFVPFFCFMISNLPVVNLQ